jgi:hypothetical protein
MLPHVDDEERHPPGQHEVLVFLDLKHGEVAASGVEPEHAPARSLNGVRGGAHLGVEGGEQAELPRDGVGERTVRGTPTVGGEVGPEDRVEDVPSAVERDLTLEVLDEGKLARGSCRSKFVESGIETVDVGKVVLPWWSSTVRAS